MNNFGFITAGAIGLSTVFGALIGFSIKKISHKQNDGIMGFAAGVMLGASFFGLIMPALENGSVLVITAGIMCGAIVISFIDKLVPHIHDRMGRGIGHSDDDMEEERFRHLNRVMLFVIAIAIHNFPEGMASGVGVGGADINNSILITVAMCIQNIPEGLVVVIPLLTTRLSKIKIFAIALIAGFSGVLGTFFGIYLVNFSEFVLPFFLAFAAGTMLYVISDEIIPETHKHGYEKLATFSLISGFCAIMFLDSILAF